jgi:dolichol-phosphate mannosyltransferase
MVEPTALPPARGRTIVIMPTYNERANLAAVVARVRWAAPTADLIIVDDDSPDGTGAVADGLAESDEQVYVLHRSVKEGLGRAYLAAFDWALAHDYDVLVEMDADGSHQPEQLERLLSALDDADVVLGSRWAPGGGVRNWPRRRVLLSRGGSLYARTMLGLPIRDVTTGYRAFRRSALERLDLHHVASAGYCFQVDLATRAVREGLRVVEVPITFVEREQGESKMSGHIVREALIRVTQWGIAHRWRQIVSRTRHNERG